MNLISYIIVSNINIINTIKKIIDSFILLFKIIGKMSDISKSKIIKMIIIIKKLTEILSVLTLKLLKPQSMVQNNCLNLFNLNIGLIIRNIANMISIK